MYKKISDKQGFTIGELLIVMAIIGILATISIPVFASRLEDSRKNTCLYNRETLTRLIRTEAMLGPIDDAKMEEIARSMGATVKKQEGVKDFYIFGRLCPSEEKGDCNYRVSRKLDGTYYVSCKAHGMGAVDYINSNPQQTVAMIPTFTFFKKFFTPGRTGSLDSTGPNFGDDVKKDLAKALNITKDFDFRIYREGTSNTYKIYISDPLPDGNDSKQVGEPGIMVSTTGYMLTLDENNNVVTMKKGETKDVGTVKRNTKKANGDDFFHYVLNPGTGYSWSNLTDISLN